MTEPLALYQVTYTGMVRAALRAFAATASAGGFLSEAARATKELDRLLHLYPQFGEPLVDLKEHSGRVYLGTVPPLVVRYAVLEDLRLVFATVLTILPRPRP